MIRVAFCFLLTLLLSSSKLSVAQELVVDTLRYNTTSCADSILFNNTLRNNQTDPLHWSIYSGETGFRDDFNNGIGLFWKDTLGVLLDTSCGSIDNSLAITFKGKRGIRYIESHLIDLSCMDFFGLDFLKGGTCNNNVAGLGSTSIIVQFSLDSGKTWDFIRGFAETGSYEQVLPLRIRTKNVIFRLAQLNSTGADNEVWIIDNFYIRNSKKYCPNILNPFKNHGTVLPSDSSDILGYFKHSKLDSGTTVVSVPIYTSDTTNPIIYFYIEFDYDKNVCADFSNEGLGCGTSVQFLNQSIDSNINYLWYFGDGDTTGQISPTHHYKSLGVYEVKLVACDFQECDSVIKQVLVSENFGPLTPPCNPTLPLSPSDFGVIFMEFDSVRYIYGGTSPLGGSDHISTDNTCDFRLNLKLNKVHSLRYHGYALGGSSGILRYHTWIDYNNDGFFEKSERIMKTKNGTSGQVNFSVPTTAVRYTPLRMRMTVFATSSSSTNEQLKDCNSTNTLPKITRDYAVIISDSTCNPPSADFKYAILNCFNQILFTDNSDSLLTTYRWSFGDGDTSSKASVIHEYAMPGTYQVQLIVGNPFGHDTVSKSVTIGNPNAQIKIEGKRLPYCPMNYNVTGDSSIKNFYWDLGNKKYSSNKSLVHSYATPGMKIVELITIDSSNCKYHHVDTLFIPELVDYVIACDSFVWIDGQTYTESTDTPTYIVGIDTAGCDTIQTLNLTITSPSNFNSSYVRSGNYLIAQNLDRGISFQWLDCSNGFTPIPGATNDSFKILSNGSYALEVGGYNCKDTSSCANIIGVGVETINGLEKKEFVKLYPNPSSNEIYIKGVKQIINATVFNIEGRLIRRIEYPSNKINVVDLKSGLYIIKIQTRVSVLTERFIVTK